MPQDQASVLLQDVSLAYGTQEVPRGLTLSVPARSIIALLGFHKRIRTSCCGYLFRDRPFGKEDFARAPKFSDQRYGNAAEGRT